MAEFGNGAFGRGFKGWRVAARRSRHARAVLLLFLLSACSSPPQPGSPQLGAPEPNPLLLSAAPGETATGILTFENTGESTLDFSAYASEAWLGVAPASGSVGAGSNRSLTVTGTCPDTAGTQAGQVIIDPTNTAGPAAEVDVTLACTSGNLQVEPSYLAFSAATGEQPDGLSFELTNTGDQSTTFDVAVDAEWLSASPQSGSLAAGASENISVSSAVCASAGEAGGLVTVTGEGNTATVSVTRTCTDPPPPALLCEEVDEGAAGPTLSCTSQEAGVKLEIPWQGTAVRAESLQLPPTVLEVAATSTGFEPLSDGPLIHLGVYDAETDQPRQVFDPPLELTVEYGPEEFANANPLLNEGELGMGLWNEAQSDWTVVGHGVFHDGFWVADPIGAEGIVLQGNQSIAQPRFQIVGKPEGGRAVALFAETYPTLAVALGAVPFDPDHMLKSFDECGEKTVEGLGTVIECSSAMVGLTVRVPLQQSGTVTPEVIALPWNKETTFLATQVEDPLGTGDSQTELDRRLMNFVVVDAADPDTVLTSFDPPMEFEVVYAPEDKDPANAVLRLNFWEEYLEEFVVLGEGACDACLDNGSPIVGCTWGVPVAAGATSDPEFGDAFFRVDEATGQGRAKFTFDRWGDRMVALGR